MSSPPNAQPERNAAIVEYYLGPPRRTLQEAGDEFGLTRERIRQIVNAYGPGTSRRTSLTQLRRFTAAIAAVAKLEERRLEHGTLRRYRGSMKEFPPCRCKACLEANRTYTYKYQPQRKKEQNHGSS